MLSYTNHEGVIFRATYNDIAKVGYHDFMELHNDIVRQVVGFEVVVKLFSLFLRDKEAYDVMLFENEEKKTYFVYDAVIKTLKDSLMTEEEVEFFGDKIGVPSVKKGETVKNKMKYHELIFNCGVLGVDPRILLDLNEKEANTFIYGHTVQKRNEMFTGREVLMSAMSIFLSEKVIKFSFENGPEITEDEHKDRTEYLEAVSGKHNHLIKNLFDGVRENE